MAHAVFAFGPGERWFFTSSNEWAWHNLPALLQHKFATDDNFRIKYVYHMVFGPDESFYAAWRAKDGKDYTWHKGLPKDLAAWIDEKDSKGSSLRKAREVRITLGPNVNTFWATDGSKGSATWANLPPGLNAAIEQLRKPGAGWTSRPRIVALGVDGSYLMINEDNGAAWKVADKYPFLDTELEAHRGHFHQIHHVTMDHFDAPNFVLMLKDGGAGWQVPGGNLNEGLQKVLTSIKEAAAKAAAEKAAAEKAAAEKAAAEKAAAEKAAAEKAAAEKAAAEKAAAEKAAAEKAAANMKELYELREAIERRNAQNAAAQKRAAAQRQRSSGLGRAFLTGLVGGMAGLSVQQQQPVVQGGGAFVNNNLFTAAMQQNMWSTVNDAASMPIQ